MFARIRRLLKIEKESRQAAKAPSEKKKNSLSWRLCGLAALPLLVRFF
jgi:hypothetical protein